MNVSTRLSHNWRSLWTLDLNALAITRVVLGLILILDLASRFQQAEILYGVDAMAPPWLVEGTFPAVWGLYLLNDSLLFTKALIGLSILSAFLWTIGFKGRWVLVVTWFLYASLFYRNSLIHSGAESTLLTALFWLLWLPHNAAYSIDAKLKFSAGALSAPQTHLSPASIAFILQVVIYYLFSGLNKDDPAWWQDGTALYYALNLDSLVSGAGLWLLDFPTVTRLLSIGTWWLEVLAPVLLLLLPLLFGQKWRMSAVCLLIILHLGIAVFMSIGNFPYINIAILIAMLPLRTSTVEPSKIALKKSPLQFRFSLGLSLVLALLVCQTIYSSLRLHDQKPPRLLRQVLLLTTTDNSFRFFAPSPPLSERFWFFPGTLYDGTEVNVFDLTIEPVEMEKSIAIDKWNRYHRKYFDQFSRKTKRSKKISAQFSKFLCQRWNKQSDLPPLKLVTLRYLMEWTADWGSGEPDYLYTARGTSLKCKEIDP